MQFKQPGPWLFALGMIGLGAAPLVALRPDLPSPGLALQLVVMELAGFGLLFRATSAASASALALCWLAAMALRVVPDLIMDPDQFPHWVSAAEALAFVAVAAAFARSGLWVGARVVLGLTITLFGGIHLLHPEAVADLLPGWFPIPAVWPYVTGAVQIAAGVMILAGFRAPLAAFAIGLMWLSWIPLVHLPRLIDAPDAGAEWIFMITALALAGAAWSVGEGLAARPGEDLQP